LAPNKRMKTINSHGNDVVSVVGEDLKVSQISDLEGKAIVFCGMSLKTVNIWMEVEWGTVLGYLPISFSLVWMDGGYFLLKILCKPDSVWKLVLGSPPFRLQTIL
jgi:hypothetical protein